MSRNKAFKTWCPPFTTRALYIQIVRNLKLKSRPQSSLALSTLKQPLNWTRVNKFSNRYSWIQGLQSVTHVWVISCVYVGPLCVSPLAPHRPRVRRRLPSCVSLIHSIQMRTALNGVELLQP